MTNCYPIFWNKKMWNQRRFIMGVVKFMVKIWSHGMWQNWLDQLFPKCALSNITRCAMALHSCVYMRVRIEARSAVFFLHVVRQECAPSFCTANQRLHFSEIFYKLREKEICVDVITASRYHKLIKDKEAHTSH